MTITSKTTKVEAGLYLVVAGDRRFKIEEVSRSEGFSKSQWNISELEAGISVHARVAAFDAAGSLRDAVEIINQRKDGQS